MADGRLERFLRRFGDVRGREARIALAVSAYFFLITFAFYIIKPVKESLLIGSTPAWWSYADLATALLIGFVVALNARLLERLPRRTYLTASLLFFIACLMAFWWIFDFHAELQFQTPVTDSSGMFFIIWAQSMVVRLWPVPVIVFCFWSDVFIAMSITQFWISVNDIFDPHQAKRLVGLFVTGGLLGGIAGSAVAMLLPLIRSLRVEGILLVAPAILVFAVITVNVLYAGQQKIDAKAGEGRMAPSTRVGYLESFRAVRSSRYLILLAAMLAAAMVAGSLINYQFKAAVRSAYENPAMRTSFVAFFFLIIWTISTIVHLATTGRFLKSYGIRWAISLAPVVLLLGMGVVFLVPAAVILVWAIVVRGADKGFDSTLSQSVRELLYIPVPAEVKYKAKIFIDMFVNKFATGLGAGLYLVMYHARRFAYRADPLTIIREIGLVTLVFVLLWLVLTRLVYRQYPAVLKSDIRKIHKEGREAVADHVDVDLTLKVFNTIQSRERSATLYYMNVFDLVRSKDLTPELRELLGIKRDELKARAMDSLVDVGGGTFFPGLEETMTDTAFQKEIDLIFLLPSYQKIMDERLGVIASSPSELDRIEAAHSIARMAARPSTLDALARLLQDPSPEVALYALHGAAVHRRPEHIPLIVRLLANPATMAEAQAALAAYGPGSEGPLAETLRSDETPFEIRRAIPEVLARIGTQKAADVLVAELARRREGMEQAVIDALYRIRTDQPEVRFREKDLRPELRRLIRSACAVVLEHAGPAPDVRAPLDIRLRRVFDLMTLMYPREDIVNDYQNIRQGTAKSVDYALEHLDNLLDREDKELLFPLLEDLPPEERLLRLKKALRLK